MEYPKPFQAFPIEVCLISDFVLKLKCIAICTFALCLPLLFFSLLWWFSLFSFVLRTWLKFCVCFLSSHTVCDSCKANKRASEREQNAKHCSVYINIIPERALIEREAKWENILRKQKKNQTPDINVQTHWTNQIGWIGSCVYDLQLSWQRRFPLSPFSFKLNLTFHETFWPWALTKPTLSLTHSGMCVCVWCTNRDVSSHLHNIHIICNRGDNV